MGGPTNRQNLLVNLSVPTNRHFLNSLFESSAWRTDRPTKSVSQFVGTDKPTLFKLIIRVFSLANRQTDKLTKSVGQFVGTDKPTLLKLLLESSYRQTDRPTNRQNLSVNLSVLTHQHFLNSLFESLAWRTDGLTKFVGQFVGTDKLTLII